MEAPGVRCPRGVGHRTPGGPVCVGRNAPSAYPVAIPCSANHAMSAATGLDAPTLVGPLAPPSARPRDQGLT